MNLTLYFDFNAAGNPYFFQIYHGIAERFAKEYPQHQIKCEQPNYEILGHSPGGPGGYSNFQIINQKNNKTIVVSFWDKGMDLFLPGMGWEKYEIIQYLGGLSISMTPEEIYNKYNIRHQPFQYSLGNRNSLENVAEVRVDYKPEEKIKKAIFIGSMYTEHRMKFREILSKHPLFEILDGSSGYYHKSYYEKINQYRVALCLNAHAETSIRETELLGLGVPMLRSELVTQFHNPYIPDYHYIRGSEKSTDAACAYPSLKVEDIADQYICALENKIDDFDFLKSISANSLKYYQYCLPGYIINLFFQLARIKDLES